VATWAGWQLELLRAASLPTAEITGEFLFTWSEHAASSCRNNPIDISRAAAGATNCRKLTSSRTAKNYGSHAAAAHAFSVQIHSGAFPALLRALRSAIPYQQPDPAAVAADLRKWGSPAMATYYLNHSQTGSGGGSGGGGGAGGQPHVHKGWHALRRSVNHRMPKAIAKAEHLNRLALRATSHGGRVRH
jgi:hypothetical protein